jgi:hypothetical protein
MRPVVKKPLMKGRGRPGRRTFRRSLRIVDTSRIARSRPRILTCDREEKSCGYGKLDASVTVSSVRFLKPFVVRALRFDPTERSVYSGNAVCSVLRFKKYGVSAGLVNDHAAAWSRRQKPVTADGERIRDGI